MRYILSFLFIVTLFTNNNAQQLVQVDGDFITENNDRAFGTYETHYDNGAIKSQYHFLDGKEHGSTKSFFKNGRLKEEGSYNYGVKTGKWTSWAENGNKIGVVRFDEKGKRDGVWEIWDENGTKRALMEYKKGERTGTWKTWNENGELTNEMKY